MKLKVLSGVVAVLFAAVLFYFAGNSRVDREEAQSIDEDSVAGSNQDRVIADGPARAMVGQDTPAPSVASQSTGLSRSRTVRDIATLPDGPLASVLDSLEEQAHSGDFQTAYRIHKALSECAKSPRTRTDYEKELLQLNTTHTDRTGRRTSDFGQSLTELEQKFSYCDGVSDSQIERSGYWLWFAAENGDLEAKTFFANSYVPAMSDEQASQLWGDAAGQAALGMLYRREAADSGSLDAMTLMGFHLLDGHIAEHDPVKATAYLLVVSSLYEHEDTPDSPRQTLAKQAFDGLSLLEREDAKRAATEILESDFCCTAFRY